MSTGAAVPVAAPRSRSLGALARVRLSPDALALAGLAALVCLLAAVTWHRWGNLDSDTGYDIVAGARVAHGQVPYVDFVYYYVPLPAAVLGAAAWIGGVTFGTFVALGIVLAAAIVGGTYALGRQLVGRLGGFLAAAITVPLAFGPNLFSYVLPYSTGATLGLLTLMLFLIGIARAARRATTANLLSAGVLAGFVGLTKPEFELALLLALTVWLALRALDGRSWRRESGLVAGPALLLPCAIYGAFLGWVSPHRLFLENLYPKAFLREAGHAVLNTRLPFTASSFFHLAAWLALYALGAALLVLAARGLASSGPTARAVWALAPLVSLMVVAVSIARPGLVRHGLKLAYGWIPAGAALAALVLLWRFRKRDGNWGADAQVALVTTVALAVLAATEYGAFFFHSTAPQMAAYSAPLAAAFLARLHLRELGRGREVLLLGACWLTFLAAAGVGLTAKDASAKSATVRGPGGSMRVTPADAAVYRPAIHWLDAQTKPGEPVLLAPQMTWLYVMADREDPLPQISLLPGVLSTEAGERSAIRRLDAAHIRAAIIDVRPYVDYGQSSFGQSFDRLLSQWVHRNFALQTIWRGRGTNSPVLQLWLRRTA